MKLKELLGRYREYGPAFWGAAMFSFSVLIAFWIEAIFGAQTELLKWAIRSIETVPVTIIIFEKSFTADIQITPFLVIVSSYALYNIGKKHLGGFYVSKPGEYFVGVYLASWGLMMVLSPFVLMSPPKEFSEITWSIFLLVYTPSRILKGLEIKNNNKNNNNGVLYRKIS